jgi:DNA-binding NarL/FixJ family response regulator
MENDIMSDQIRVLLVDDHAVLRSGLAALLSLESDMDVVGQVGTGEEAIQRIPALRPQVVVMDLDMPGMGGLEATRQIVEMGLPVKVLVLTSHEEERSLLAVLEAGGSGYVNKTKAEQDLIEAIRTVSRDEVFLYPSATRLLLLGYRKAEERGEASPVEELSEREREVLALTAEGFSSSEVGKKLFLSPKTVDTYRARIMKKLGLGHRSDLVRFALRHGLLRAD